jgi:pilus assembly protein CpaF
VGMEGDIVTLQDIFTYDHSMGFDEHGKTRGQLKSMGLRPRFLSKLEEHGVTVDPMVFAAEGFGRR